jgi:hypothetical protein
MAGQNFPQIEGGNDFKPLRLEASVLEQSASQISYTHEDNGLQSVGA